MKRQNGSGTLIKTSTGLFIAKWVFHGKVYTRSTKCYDRDKAVEKLAEFTRPFMEDSEIGVLENIQAKLRTIEKTKEEHKIPLKEVFERYTNNINITISNGTKNLRRTIFNVFLKWVNKNYPSITYVNDISKTIMEQFFLYLQEKEKPCTYNNYLAYLRLIFDIVYKKDNVLHLFKKKKVIQEEKRVLNKEEIERLLSSCTTIEEKILFYVAVFTGMRRSDIYTLKWKNVNFEKGCIEKISIKTNKPFIVPLHPKLLELFKATNYTQDDLNLGDLDYNGILDSNDASLILELYKTRE